MAETIISRSRAARIAAIAELARTVAGDSSRDIAANIKAQYPMHQAVVGRSAEAIRHDLLASQR